MLTSASWWVPWSMPGVLPHLSLSVRVLSLLIAVTVSSTPANLLGQGWSCHTSAGCNATRSQWVVAQVTTQSPGDVLKSTSRYADTTSKPRSRAGRNLQQLNMLISTKQVGLAERAGLEVCRERGGTDFPDGEPEDVERELRRRLRENRVSLCWFPRSIPHCDVDALMSRDPASKFVGMQT